ncbi:MAG: DUF4838 domain-containing protein [Kiritimatiellae bacterium]|nr:DUF4838 domain-containing protein [Kiritimatiellia bacterium]
MNVRRTHWGEWSRVGALLLLAVAGPAMAVDTAVFKIARGADNVIVTCPDSPKSVAAYNRRYAAHELADYLERVTGARISVVDTIDTNRIEAGGVIFVGPSACTDTLGIPRDRSDLGAGGYRIATIGKNLVILGDDMDGYDTVDDHGLNGEAGTYYGVAAFLEKFCGVRWLWPGELGTVVPRQRVVRIPRVDIRSQPAYRTRVFGASADTHLQLTNGTFVTFGGEQKRQWALFHRRHGCGSSIVPYGGHYGDTYVKTNMFTAHPEYFAYYDGKRQPWPATIGQGGQVCNSNPDVVRLFAETIASNWPAHDDGRMLSLCPNDGWGFCLCDRCKAMDTNSRPWPMTTRESGTIPGARYNEKGGGAYDISERIWTFNNQVARLVAERAPQARMQAYAYSCYSLPPEGVLRIEDNICVTICDLSITSESSRFKEGWDRVGQWSQKAKNLGLYAYNLGQSSRPRHFAGTVRRFHNLGGVLYHSESCQAWGNRWSENVVGMKALWDPSLDADAVLDAYLTAGFGSGAKAIRKYLDVYEQASLLSDPFERTPKYPRKCWPPAVRAELRSILDEALHAAKGTEAKARVRFVEEGWELLDSMSGLAESAADLKGMGLAMSGFDQDTIPSTNATPEEIKARVVQGKRCWERLCALMKAVEARKGFSAPWFSRNVYAGSFWGEQVLSWGTAMEGYNDTLVEGVAMALPIEWKFQIDPAREGESAGWFKNDWDDSRWRKLRTDACWEAQGFGLERYPENAASGYDGNGWYRIGVEIPEARDGQKTWLELGAVDESFTVWVNGQRCATFDFDKQPDKEAWQKPHRIDVTGLVKYGATNVIAVDVVDRSGAGGIWKPCFIRFDVKKNDR